MTEPILRAEGVVKHYPLTRGIIFKKQPLFFFFTQSFSMDRF